jgi:RNA polymerase-binding transcription factor DksA
MTTTKAELYDVLTGLRGTYQEKLEQLESANALDITGTGYTNHQADDATMVYDQTVDVSTFKAVKDRLRQVEEAIARYEAGTYGICENCGREIDIARLEAIPYTPLCLHCAETVEYQAGI